MKPKICFIVSSPLTSKAFLENHFKVLSLKFELILVANLSDRDNPKYFNEYLSEIKHIPIHRKINLINDIKSLFLLFFYLKSKNISAVITFTPKASLIGILASYFSNIKIRICFFTGQVWHTKKNIVKLFFMYLDKFVVFFSSNIMVDGQAQRKFLINNNIIKYDNSVVIGKGTISGVDINKFKPNLELRFNLRAKLNIKDNDIVFLFLGRLNKDKGIFDLLDAFVLLNQLNIKLLIVGPDEENIYSKIKQNYNLSNIILFGPTNLSHELIQVCDVFCLPSHREAFGLSVIEASSCAKPIICSDTYGLKDTIIDNITGLRHITKDVNSLFNKMDQLANDQKLREFLGSNGRNYVVENFSTNLFTELWDEYFTKLIQTNKLF